MTNKEKETIYNDTEWIKIVFTSSYSSGEIVMKKSLFELRRKKFEKQFKGLEFYITPDYQPTLEDIVKMDNKANYYKKRMFHYNLLVLSARILNNDRKAEEYLNLYNEASKAYNNRFEEIKEEFY